MATDPSPSPALSNHLLPPSFFLPPKTANPFHPPSKPPDPPPSSLPSLPNSKPQSSQHPLPCSSETPGTTPMANPSNSSSPTWTSLFKNLPRNAGKYSPIHMDLSFSEDALLPPTSVISAGEAIWNNYIVGFFLDKPLSYTYVIGYLKRKWHMRGKIQVKSDGNIFLFLLSDEEDRDRIIRGDPIVMKNKLFIIKQWDISTSNVCGSVRAVPIWVKFTNIPIYLWSPLAINCLANRIGKLVCLDESTESLQHIQFAKCLIEVTPDQELVETFPIQNPDGSRQQIKVSYLWKPDICVHCKLFGHTTLNCQLLKLVLDDGLVGKEIELKPLDKNLIPSGNGNNQSKIFVSRKKDWKLIGRSRGRKEEKKMENIETVSSQKVNLGFVAHDNASNVNVGSSSNLKRKGNKTLLNYFSLLESVDEDGMVENVGNNSGEINREEENGIVTNDGTETYNGDGYKDEIEDGNNEHGLCNQTVEKELIEEILHDDGTVYSIKATGKEKARAKRKKVSDKLRCTFSSASDSFAHNGSVDINGSAESPSTVPIEPESILRNDSNQDHAISSPSMHPASLHKQPVLCTLPDMHNIHYILSEATMVSPSSACILNIGNTNIFSSPEPISNGKSCSGHPPSSNSITCPNEIPPSIPAKSMKKTKVKHPTFKVGNSKESNRKKVLKKRNNFHASPPTPSVAELDGFATSVHVTSPSSITGRTRSMKTKL